MPTGTLVDTDVEVLALVVVRSVVLDAAEDGVDDEEE